MMRPVSVLESAIRLLVLASIAACAVAPVATSAQQKAPAASRLASEDQTRADRANSAGDVDPYFKDIYREFYERYRLGPEDEIAIRVVGQPDYTLEKTQITPFGRVYHPLLGEIDVAGLTTNQLTERLTESFGQYIRNPAVSVSLLTANSAKIGVLGDVTKPGIIIMTRPMTILDAITASGGVTDLGKQTNVTLLRQIGEGRMQTTTVNVKRILQGKAAAEENPTLKAGDTVIVHGNFKKTLATITQLAGFGYFIHTVATQ
jgi:polysaccharide biosynthesis/export protein